MMLHRHFDKETPVESMTKLSDMNQTDKEFVSDIFPPEEQTEQPKRGRKKKTTEE